MLDGDRVGLRPQSMSMISLIVLMSILSAGWMLSPTRVDVGWLDKDTVKTREEVTATEAVATADAMMASAANGNALVDASSASSLPSSSAIV